MTPNVTKKTKNSKCQFHSYLLLYIYIYIFIRRKNSIWLTRVNLLNEWINFRNKTQNTKSANSNPFFNQCYSCEQPLHKIYHPPVEMISRIISMLVMVEDYDNSSTKQCVDRVTKTKRITITHLALSLSPASNVVSLSLV